MRNSKAKKRLTIRQIQESKRVAIKFNSFKIGQLVKIRASPSPHFGCQGIVFGVSGPQDAPYQVRFWMDECTYNKNELIEIKPVSMIDGTVITTIADDAIHRLDEEIVKKIKS